MLGAPHISTSTSDVSECNSLRSGTVIGPHRFICAFKQDLDREHCFFFSVETSGEGSRLSGHHAFLTDRDIYLHQAPHGWEDHQFRYRPQSECMLEHEVQVG
jgi:hypothetical protein